MQKGTTACFFARLYGHVFCISFMEMKKSAILIFCLLVMTSAAASAYGASGKNLRLLFFYRDNCKWCKMMDDVIYDPSIKKIFQNNISVEKINVYGTEKLDGEGLAGTGLKRRYGVFGVPTLIFIGPGNKELLRIPGVVTKEDFKDLVCHRVGIKSLFCAK